jgi:peptidoglycan/xylan/chitin deacetylase (PgdA/CDA1 family)
VPAGFIGKKFENRPVVDLKTLKGLVKSGHEIASHTRTHANLLKLSRKDKTRAISEIAGSKTELENLLGCEVSSFVFPYIKSNQSSGLRLKVKKYYKSLRITCDRPCFNRLPVKDPYKLSGFAVTKRHSVSYLNKQADRAAKENSWLIEVFHLVGKRNTLSAHRPKPYRFFVHIDDFKRHIDHILSKKLTLVTQNHYS